MIDKKILYIKGFYITTLFFFFILVAGEYLYFGFNISENSFIYPLYSILAFTPIILTILIAGILRIILIIFSIRKLYRLSYQICVKIGWYICLLIFINYSILFSTDPTFITSYMSILYQISVIGILLSNIYLSKTKIKLTNQKLLMIKKNLIDLGTNFTRLTIQDVAERCNMSSSIVDNALSKMINMNEIYASYVQKTGLIEFDQESNIKDIDNLLKKYTEWEEDKIGKKII